jgi:hypothetical protein
VAYSKNIDKKGRFFELLTSFDRKLEKFPEYLKIEISAKKIVM